MHYVVDGEARTAGHYVVDGVARAVCSCLPKCSKASWMAELISLAIWPWTSAPNSASPTISSVSVLKSLYTSRVPRRPHAPVGDTRPAPALAMASA